MLKTRLITAVVLLAVFVPALFFAPLGGLGMLLAAALGYAAWEWACLLKLRQCACVAYALSTGLALMLILILDHLGARGLHNVYWAAAIFWIGVAPFALARRPALIGAWRLFLLAAGVVIFIACGYALIKARAIGAPFALSIASLVWLTDSGAYFVGKRLGRHALAPSISPAKSWEGVLGGVLLALTGAISIALLEPTPLFTVFSAYVAQLGALGALVVLSALVGFSVVGDLFESLLKRQAGVKDSGTLLPGHGGVLDRIDALLPVLPIAMLLLN